MPEDDYRRTFNLGVGMILAVGERQARRGGEDPRGPERAALPHRPRDPQAAQPGGPGDLPVRRLGILLSGRGSNFEAIANSIDAGRLNAEIAVVVSNRPEARGLEIARARGLSAVSLPSKGLDRDGV